MRKNKKTLIDKIRKNTDQKKQAEIKPIDKVAKKPQFTDDKMLRTPLELQESVNNELWLNGQGG